MKIVDSKEISEYIDWNHLNELEDLNPKRETLLVGYWKKYFDNVREHYVKNIVVDVKDGQHLYLQHREDLPYDLVLFVTDITMSGDTITDMKSKVKGGIIVEGNLKHELTDGTMHSFKFLSDLKHQMEMSNRAKLTVLASDKHIVEKIKTYKERKKEKEKSEEKEEK